MNVFSGLNDENGVHSFTQVETHPPLLKGLPPVCVIELLESFRLAEIKGVGYGTSINICYYREIKIESN